VWETKFQTRTKKDTFVVLLTLVLRVLDKTRKTLVSESNSSKYFPNLICFYGYRNICCYYIFVYLIVGSRW
jgi:hypothetical protein